MKRGLRGLWAWVLSLVLLFTPQLVAAAGDYPQRPIRLLVGFGPGGPTDLTFRKLAELAAKDLGQPIIVENKPGVGATLAASTMARQDKPDGYTIAAATAGMFRVPYMQKVDWDPIRDFTWIAGLGGYTFVLAVKADSPYKTAADLVNFAKANPGRVSVATAGAGTSMHLLTEAFAANAGVELTHVGYKSSSEAAVSLLGGQTVAAVDAVGSLLPHVQSGALRLLMSFDAEPPAWLPGVPTAKSLGYGVANSAPYGLIGPRGMPPAVVDRLAAAFKKAVDDPEYAKLLERLGQTYWFSPPAEYGRFAAEYYVSERALVEQAKLMRQQ
ncbi:MAG: tripartite tricarboxylate transporter substrate binding protein [Pigmentiphaga sp.]|uniref:tripartite tricarboxylate transporter substrate binding protein n=1 Tax=Pigmentiphaga sp. TaxID=1977564 RepID=UPI0029AEF6DB|nr:tripartite tricarboxylate transporter substrate binding protein [Pigmentiphaga sp.]MDX3906195.1 tripartite tricarboxylate transporter substrate binding protein [Pigmentiphaga sp.]